MPNNHKDENIKIAILGGGIGGCMAALILSKKFPDVSIFIFEKNKNLLLGTSNCTPGRMGLGFHYIHSESALTYLHQTLDFVKYFNKSCPDLMVGQQFPLSHPLRNGRYFIVKNSLFSSEEILKTYDKLAAEYSQLVEEDSQNEIFGKPNDFYKILKKEEYENDVNLEQVEIGIETREHLLNWPRFREFLLNEITNHEKIKILYEEVEDIRYLYTQSAYVIDTKQGAGATFSSEKVDFVINATWEWVDYFNSKIGYYRSPEQQRTNRAKALVKVELPYELNQINSMFFCMGPFCMFSNEGDGYGFITYAPETNQKNSTNLIPEKDYLELISGNILPDIKERIAEDIIKGVSNYIPNMIKAKAIEVRFGTVQVMGEADIFDPSSRMHERDYMGLEYLEEGFVSLPCMKLLYGYGNAEKVARLFDQFKKIILPAAEEIKKITLKKICQEEEIKDKDKNIKISLLSGLCFSWFKRAHVYNCNANIRPIENFCNIFFKKLEMNKEFIERNFSKKEEGPFNIMKK